VKIRYASLTDVGVKRSHNQDACASQPAADDAVWRTHGHVFIVADGMGGHAVGEKASAKAVRDIPLTYQKHVAQEGVRAAILRAFQEANQAIFAIGKNNPEFKGLGTTATAMVIRPEGAWVGHVGDSRAYRIRNGRVQQLTFDHSWVWEVARRQGIDPDELGDFKRNVIIRSLGPDAEVEVDLEGPHPVEPGDVFLLCSDGLSNLVTPDEIGAVVTSFPPEEAVPHLVALANLRGGPDNITCLIIHVPGGGGASGASGVGGLRRAFEVVNRVVPWPYLSLGFGVTVAGLSVWLKSAAMPGAMPAFLLAAVLIVAGLVGLYLQLRGQSEDGHAASSDEPVELRLYRDYAFEVGKPIADRFAELDATLKDSTKDKDLGIDWKAHDKFVAEADKAAGRSDWGGMFRSWFLAVQAVAAGVNKHRQKDEVFQPNWTSPTRALGAPGE
jgi:serine/threonine protein phosphatase PrpC